MEAERHVLEEVVRQAVTGDKSGHGAFSWAWLRDIESPDAPWLVAAPANFKNQPMA